MEHYENESFRNGNASEIWLGEEFERLARRIGAGQNDCAALKTIVEKLVAATSENGETHWSVSEESEKNFLEKATARVPLNLLTGTPERFLSGEKTPLIFDKANNALYFFRRYKQEFSTAKKISALTKIPAGDVPASDEKTEKIIAAALPFPLNARQKQAVRAIVSNAFTIITGGPGTGKTTLLLRALLCLFSQNPDAKIALAAPTGKAAGRMKDAILSQLNAIAAPEIPVPENILKSVARLEPTTLHRLLRTGMSPLKNLPVPEISADCVVVDEASMIDQALAFRLFCAVSPRTRVVLLGDKNQLDSVGAGHVFGALCETEFLRENRVELTESRRFSEEGILGKFANAIVSGDVPAAKKILSEKNPVSENICFSEKEISPSVLEDALRKLFPAEIQHVPANADPEKMLKLVESVRVLAPIRGGNCGTEMINATARKIFAPPGTQTHRHFHGQPIIITRNAPQNRLFNGDVGIVLKATENNSLFAFFRDDDKLKRVPAAFLPMHETAYAMSIHKAQGSEFSRLLIVFPPEIGNAELFSRQLLYTAVTRFREHGNDPYFRLLFDKESLCAAIARRSENSSLLAQHFNAIRASDNAL